jgi:mRNA turnover protein 4
LPSCLLQGGLPFPHTLEPALHAAGVPSRLNKGVVELLAPHTVCEVGRPLGQGAASVLKMLDLKLATFAMHLDSVWENGELTVISEPPERV